MKRLFISLSLALTGAGVAFAGPFTDGSVLTAAALNNALAAPTITGGSINGAPIGATTPSTGAFTALSASAVNPSLQYQRLGGTSRSLIGRLEDRVDALDFPGCDPTGATNSDACIQAAIDSFPAAAASGQVGGEVDLPPGTFKLAASLDLTGHPGVVIHGAGMYATVLQPTGNFPAVVDHGQYTAVDNKVGVQHLWVQCPGQSNSNAMGISFTYVNSGRIVDDFFTGCNHALDMYDEWQTVIDGVRVDGQGTQQNAIGIYAGAPTNSADTMPNNALVVTNTTVQNVSQYAYRLAYFAGSKFSNDEGTNGITAWYLCDAAYVQSGIPCRFGHFANILGDTTSGPSMTIQQGANTNPATDLMFTNVWMGNSGTEALLINGATYITAQGLHVDAADDGLYIKNSNNIDVQADVHAYNRNNNGSYAVVLDGTTASKVHALTQTGTTVLGYNGIEEINGSAGNQLWGGAAACAVGVAFGGAATGLTYGTQSCQYEVKGMEVDLQFYSTMTALGSSTGAATLTGLPIAVASSGASMAYGGVTTLLANNTTGLSGPILAEGAPASTTVNLYNQSATGTSALTNANFTNSTTLYGRLSYFKQ